MELICIHCRTIFLRSSVVLHNSSVVNSGRVYRVYSTLSGSHLQKPINNRLRKDKEELIKEKPIIPQSNSIKAVELPPSVEWKEQYIDLKTLPSIYLKLSKYRLTSLVVLTTLVGYAMAPGSSSMSVLLCGCLGTALCSAAANTFNQWIEVPFDSQMARTRNRVLVRRQISPLHALSFGVISGLTGATLLVTGVNTLTALLGVFNITLYSAVYTPMKRLSIVNTWIGSVVGAIPPLMGWTACTGSLSPAAGILGGILFAWQFPHFNALSWSHQADYSRGGYRMMSVTNPDLCRKVALRYSLALIPLCTAAPMFGLTTWWFALDSLPVNLWFSYLAWKFYKDSDFKSARKLFRFSLFHLPLLFGLMLINKKSWRNNETPDRMASLKRDSEKY